jgi:hypothetical protein
MRQLRIDPGEGDPRHRTYREELPPYDDREDLAPLKTKIKGVSSISIVHLVHFAMYNHRGRVCSGVAPLW